LRQGVTVSPPPVDPRVLTVAADLLGIHVSGKNGGKDSEKNGKKKNGKKNGGDNAEQNGDKAAKAAQG
jgi:hypothetical protein